MTLADLKELKEYLNAVIEVGQPTAFRDMARHFRKIVQEDLDLSLMKDVKCLSPMEEEAR
jgi:hypothetical protein